MTTTPHFLLVTTPEGGTAAVRFPSIDAARDWEDAHPNIQGVGCIPLASKSEAAAW